MTSAFRQINPHLQEPVTLREGAIYEVPVQILAAAGFLCSVEVKGDAFAADWVQEIAANDSSEGHVVVGSAGRQVLRLTGVRHGVGTLVLRHARPWQGAADDLAEEIEMQVAVCSLEVQSAWEAQVPVDPVSDAQVRHVLDVMDGRKPYGGKKFSCMRQALEVLAKDVAVHRFAGKDYELADWKVEAFVRAFPPGLLLHAYPSFARRGLEAFVASRLD